MRSHFINVGKGKQTNMLLTKFTSSELDVINVYRSSNGNSVELLNNMIAMMTLGKPLLVTGDFNHESSEEYNEQRVGD